MSLRGFPLDGSSGSVLGDPVRLWLDSPDFLARLVIRVTKSALFVGLIRLPQWVCYLFVGMHNLRNFAQFSLSVFSVQEPTAAVDRVGSRTGRVPKLGFICTFRNQLFFTYAPHWEP